MKVNTTPVSKSQLLDYVTKFEFNEFRSDVTDRFDAIDKRLSSIDRRFNDLEEKFRLHTGVLLQESREYFKAAMEYMRHVESKKLDKEEFELLEVKINNFLDPVS